MDKERLSEKAIKQLLQYAIMLDGVPIVGRPETLDHFKIIEYLLNDERIDSVLKEIEGTLRRFIDTNNYERLKMYLRLPIIAKTVSLDTLRQINNLIESNEPDEEFKEYLDNVISSRQHEGESEARPKRLKDPIFYY